MIVNYYNLIWRNLSVSSAIITFFWEQHKDLYNTACMLIKNNMEKLSKTEYSTDKKLLEDATAFLEMKG